MQRNTNSLAGYKIGATDGEIGEVKEFYFNDQIWTIRYFIVETGNWLIGRKVLLSPQALHIPDWENKIFPVNLSKEQIKNSPDIDTDKPVSRKLEIALNQHYSWQRYEGGGFYAGGSAGLLNLAPMADETELDQYADTIIIPDGDHHLRSSRNVTGYHIHATDGGIGHVKDFIVDDQSWAVIDLVIDTHNRIGGKKVLLPVRYVKEIQPENSNIITDVTVAFIKECVLFDESQFKNR